MAWGLLLDGLIALLLLATIGYCYVLHRRLRTFMRASEEMRAAVAGFANATMRAEASTAGLRKAANEAGTDLAKQVEAARSSAETLRLLNESAERLARQLDQGSTGRRSPGPLRAAPELTDANALTEERARSEAERELLQAMRQVR